ncbi:uncharacterized protein A4U43_C06F1040 [Asparagus officinalis]|uniref:Uncharacterized protein n=1 Tax=Asparagus officinalis TaxID=4686 RepID=A0A5P1EJ45_ASPOF|nr:ribonuclease H2 subunit C [Asparagus officinalis]ONK65794.1 uncharacterized protein A4U43_C06F1040 [Asparagus officinalis]
MNEETTKNAGIRGTIDLAPRDPPSISDLTDRVHLLPCSIKLDGPSEISHYFKPRDTEVVVDGLSVKEAYFRGRKLLGATVPIPEGFKGYVLDKKKLKKGKITESLEGDFGQWESRAEFGNITYWNHDTHPSADDPLLRCFHWFSVADALHKPITTEELASYSTASEKAQT